MNFREAALSIILTVSPFAATSQRPTLQLLAGMGLNGVRSQPTPSEYFNIVLPRVGAGLRIPLTPRVAILTGVDFQQKGFRSRQLVYEDEPGDFLIIESKLRYGQLHVPLQVSIELLPKKRYGLEFAAGMTYGFMMNAKANSTWNYYRKDRFVRAYDYELEPKISLLPYDNRLAVSNPQSYGAMYLFNPALAGSFTLRAKNRVLLQLYGEYNLYDASTVSVSRLHLYTVGIAVGYRL